MRTNQEEFTASIFTSKLFSVYRRVQCEDVFWHVLPTCLNNCRATTHHCDLCVPRFPSFTRHTVQLLPTLVNEHLYWQTCNTFQHLPKHSILKTPPLLNANTCNTTLITPQLPGHLFVQACGLHRKKTWAVLPGLETETLGYCHSCTCCHHQTVDRSREEK